MHIITYYYLTINHSCMGNRAILSSLNSEASFICLHKVTLFGNICYTNKIFTIYLDKLTFYLIKKNNNKCYIEVVLKTMRSLLMT